jgi:hypothetical protein
MPVFKAQAFALKVASEWQTVFSLCRRNRRKHLVINGVPGGIRTPNLLIRSQKLYPVELQAQIFKNPKGQIPIPKVRVTSLELGICDLEFGICEMGWPTGLEPATTRTTIWGSTIELRPPTVTRNKILRFQSAFANPVSVGCQFGQWPSSLFAMGQGKRTKGGAFNLSQTKDSTFAGGSTNSRRRWNENLPAALLSPWLVVA